MSRTLKTPVTDTESIAWTAVPDTGNRIWIGTVKDGQVRYRVECTRFDDEGVPVWRLSWHTPQPGYWNQDLRSFTTCRNRAAVVEKNNIALEAKTSPASVRQP